MVCSNDRFEIVLKPFITFLRIIMVVCLKGFRKQFEIRTKYMLVSIANFIMRAKGHEHVNHAFRKLVRRAVTLVLGVYCLSLSKRWRQEFRLIIRTVAM